MYQVSNGANEIQIKLAVAAIVCAITTLGSGILALTASVVIA